MWAAWLQLADGLLAQALLREANPHVQVIEFGLQVRQDHGHALRLQRAP